MNWKKLINIIYHLISALSQVLLAATEIIDILWGEDNDTAGPKSDNDK